MPIELGRDTRLCVRPLHQQHYYPTLPFGICCNLQRLEIYLLQLTTKIKVYISFDMYMFSEALKFYGTLFNCVGVVYV